MLQAILDVYVFHVAENTVEVQSSDSVVVVSSDNDDTEQETTAAKHVSFVISAM